LALADRVAGCCCCRSLSAVARHLFLELRQLFAANDEPLCEEDGCMQQTVADKRILKKKKKNSRLGIGTPIKYNNNTYILPLFSWKLF